MKLYLLPKYYSVVSKINNSDRTAISSPSYCYRYCYHEYTKSKVDFTLGNYNVDSRINIIKHH